MSKESKTICDICIYDDGYVCLSEDCVDASKFEPNCDLCMYYSEIFGCTRLDCFYEGGLLYD